MSARIECAAQMNSTAPSVVAMLQESMESRIASMPYWLFQESSA
jgi:hypothetical protein